MRFTGSLPVSARMSVKSLSKSDRGTWKGLCLWVAKFQKSKSRETPLEETNELRVSIHTSQELP